MRRIRLSWERTNARMRRGDDEGVALLTALLFMILVAGLSVVLLSVILSQAMPVYTAQKSTKTVYSAQAGLQAALGVVRSLAKVDPTTGNTTGIRASLPCSVSGKVDGSDSTSTYFVTMKYFMTDPTGKDTAWQNSNDMDCTGTVLPGTTQPLYAMAFADGRGAAIPGKSDATIGDRHISAIYKFRVTNVNIPGGRIWDYGNTFCLESGSPSVGATVTLKATANCTSASDSTQLWVYDTDYEIKLASSLAVGRTPLCITSPVNTTSTAAASGAATLTACKAKTDASRWPQLWSWTGSNSWVGQNALNTSNTGFCLSPGTIAAGSVLTVQTSCSGGFSPSTAVGAGAASFDTKQIVNYKEFGRCADVTDQKIGNAFMISYPCKQDPTGTGTQLLWNHKWYYTEPTKPNTSVADQAIIVHDGGNTSSKYCLTAPAKGSKLVTFTLCSSPLSTNQKWTRFSLTDSADTSFTFVDKGFSRCLSVDASDTYTAGKWSKMIVATCNGSLEQKWNAPATFTASEVSGYREYGQ